MQRRLYRFGSRSSGLEKKMVQKVSSVSLREALRTQTSRLHQQLESTVEERGSFSSVQDYSQWLVTMQRMHHLFAADYDAGCLALGLPPLSPQLSRALARDTGTHLPTNLHRRLSDDAALGAAYVFEGSALGARVLLRRSIALAPVPVAYLSMLVAESVGRWPKVKRRCSEICLNPMECDHPAIAGAAVIFSTFERAFAAEPA